jgi:hypothetical protein
MVSLASKRALAFALLLIVATSPVLALAATSACPGKVAFIGLPADYDLTNAQPLIQQLDNETYPVNALEFHYLTTPVDLAHLDAAVDELEAQVVVLKNRGFYRIGLPVRSILLAPYFDGSAGSLGGVDIDTRHPGVVFTVTNLGTSTVDSPHADSVFRFLDLPTLSDTVVQIESLLGPAGSFLIVYQEGDVVSEAVRDSYLAAAATLSRSTQAVSVPFDGTHFDAAALANAKTALLALPAGSLVVHIVNGALTDPYTNDALTADLFVEGAGVRHVAGNYFPSAPLPVALELGQSLVWNPSQITEGLGLPTKYEEWISDPMVQSVALHLEEYVWMATCGTSPGLLDGFLAFDVGGTSIQFQLERSYIPVGSPTIAVGERRSNPRWYSDQVALNTVALFDHIFFTGFE